MQKILSDINVLYHRKNIIDSLFTDQTTTKISAEYDKIHTELIQKVEALDPIIHMNGTYPKEMYSLRKEIKAQKLKLGRDLSHKEIAVLSKEKLGYDINNDIERSESNKKKILITFELAKVYKENISKLIIPDFYDEFFLVKIFRTIFDNISKQTYASGETRANHGGVNHMRSVALSSYFMETIKRINNKLFNNTTANGNTQIISIFLLASYFYSILRVSEESGEGDNIKMPKSILNEIFKTNIFVNPTYIVRQYGLSSAVFFYCLLNNLNVPDDIKNHKYVINIPYYLISLPSMDTGPGNEALQCGHFMVLFGHFMDHCRYPVGWSQIESLGQMNKFLKYVTASYDYYIFDNMRKDFYMFTIRLMERTGYVVDKFYMTDNDIQKTFKPLSLSGYSDIDKLKLPCYNIVTGSHSDITLDLHENFYKAFNTVFNYDAFEKELSLAKPLLHTVKSNIIVPKYLYVPNPGIDPRDLDNYENNYIIKQQTEFFKYISNLVNQNTYIGKFDINYDWTQYFMDNFIDKYTKNFYNDYNELLSYKNRYSNGLFSFLSTFGTWKLDVSKYLSIQILTFLIMNCKYDSDIKVVRGVKNNAKTFTQQEQKAVDKIDLFISNNISMEGRKTNIFSILKEQKFTLETVNSMIADLDTNGSNVWNIVEKLKEKQPKKPKKGGGIPPFPGQLKTKAPNPIAKGVLGNDIKKHKKNTIDTDIVDLANSYKFNTEKIKPLIMPHLSVSDVIANLNVLLEDENIKNLKVLWHVDNLDNKYVKNKVINEPTFISTSLSLNSAVNYINSSKPTSPPNKCCIINILIPKNNPVLWVRGFGPGGVSEHELLLPPNSNFQVVKEKNQTVMKNDVGDLIEDIDVVYNGTDNKISEKDFLVMLIDYILLKDRINEKDIMRKYKDVMFK